MAPKVVMTMADWRLEVVLEPERTGQSVVEVCRRHEISRDTFYRWKRRFDAVGIMGLIDISREPINQPRRVAAELEDVICGMRRQHPRWGARTIRTRLKRTGVEAPAISTVHRVLKRYGLVAPNPKKTPKVLLRRFERPEPNDLWQMDSIGFELLDGSAAEVVNVLDDHARFHLAGVAAEVVTGETTWEAFVRASREHGLPRQVFTDNHLSFTGRMIGRVVEFERLVAATGVELIHGRPGHPQGRGKIERFHRTLREYVEDAGGGRDLAGLQSLVDQFRPEYNQERPHQAIADVTPAERYRPSPRALGHDETLVDPDYPPDAIVRRVSVHGVVCWNYIKINVGVRWGGRIVAVHPENGWIHIRFGDSLIRSIEHHPEITYHPRRRTAG